MLAAGQDAAGLDATAYRGAVAIRGYRDPRSRRRTPPAGLLSYAVGHPFIVPLGLDEGQLEAGDLASVELTLFDSHSVAPPCRERLSDEGVGRHPIVGAVDVDE